MNNRTGSFLLRVILIVFLNAAAASASAATQQWAGFRGPDFNGSVSGTQFAGSSGGEIAVAWRAPAGPAYSGVSIADGKAVTLFSDGTSDVLAAFDAKSGKQLWRYVLAPAYKGYDGSHDGVIATSAIAEGKVFSLHPGGRLAAVDLASGKEVWAVNVTEHGGTKPYYGFGSSPVVAGGVVAVQIGGETGKTVTAFDASTGKLKWTAGDDKIQYQSPLLVRAGGRELILAAGAKKLFFLEPSTGKPVLEYEHGGDEDAVAIMVPVPFEKDRILLRHKEESSDVIQLVSAADGKLSVEKVWNAPVFKNTYSIPVYYNGYLYGFNGRVLTAVDAATGETKWRSRGVEDGFLILVDGNLVIQTKAGVVYVGPASPEGWKETARLSLFKDISWTPPSFAGGAVFTRSHGEIASLEWREAVKTSAPVIASAATPKSSGFAEFLSAVNAAQDKKAVVDRFFAAQKTFPVIEWPDRVVFLFRGEVQDLAIAGDIQGAQREDQMQRIAGTDVYYYVAQLEPDARIHYRFVKNYEEMIYDPLNPRQTKDRRGGALSWVSMPGWKEPQYLQEAPADKRGTLETHELKSAKREGASVKLEVYLPAGYASGTNKYPVVYIHDQGLGRSLGLLTNALDNLIGTTIQPVIAVFLAEVKTGPERLRDPLEQSRAVTALLTEEVLPFVDSRYRTRTDAQSRALAGGLEMGTEVVLAAFNNPNLFGGVAAHSMWIDSIMEKALQSAIGTPQERPIRIYMDWGLYDARSMSDGWDIRRENRKFYNMLRDAGFRPAGGETRESYGWPSWRNRAANWLSALFPL